MATQAVHQPSTLPLSKPQIVIPQPQRIIPLKVGVFGDQGSGKTTTSALLAAALSKQFHGGAPVWVTDPELGWKFLRRRIFAKEGIPLEIKTVPTFAAMMKDMRDAERAGACCYAVELGKIWLELLASCRKNAGQNWGNELNKLWGSYVNAFLNSPMHCIGLGRVGDVTETILDENGQEHRIKTGEKMRAGGSANPFGYEPHLVFRMSLEIKPAVRKGEKIDNEGRMVHKAHVVKDRTWALNGQMLRWSDKAKYEPGGYRQVWQSIKPHFDETQLTEDATLDTSATSAELFSDDGQSDWYERRQRKEVLTAELHASMELLWGGTAKEAKQMRMKVFEHVFGFRSKEAADAASLDKIERGVRIIQAFEQRCKKEESLLSKGDLEILAQLDIDIREYDEGKAVEEELPF